MEAIFEWPFPLGRDVEVDTEAAISWAKGYKLLAQTSKEKKS